MLIQLELEASFKVCDLVSLGIMWFNKANVWHFEPFRAANLLTLGPLEYVVEIRRKFTVLGITWYHIAVDWTSLRLTNANNVRRPLY